MTTELSNFAARLLPFMRDTARQAQDNEFKKLALELFALQFKHNAAYRKICEARLPRRSGTKAGGLTPKVVGHWTQIPAVPTATFKELELTCLAPNERTAVFHSSGTTEQKPSRHYHGAESLKVYEASLLSWFLENVLTDLRSESKSAIGNPQSAIFLTPPPAQAPHSSLVHMFETVRKCSVGCPQPTNALGTAHATASAFVGKLAADGTWTLDFDAVLAALSPHASSPAPRALLLLGTAFSFVHLLDFLVEKDLRFNLPAGSRVMETGGYKNRSRSMPKLELHALITERLGIPPENIICEYGMSELSSQAYEQGVRSQESEAGSFQFPPWARVQIVSPETGREVAEGETGLIRVFDLANVFSVMAVQTEDLGIRRADGFELLGRAEFSEPRGCSLMAHIAHRTPQFAIK